MSGSVLGIDPGAHGAIAILDEAGHLIDVIDMPSTIEANGRTATNAPLLASIIAGAHARIAFVEFVAARPTDAKIAAFAFGRARGVIEGVCGALSLPGHLYHPANMEEARRHPGGHRAQGFGPHARYRSLARNGRHVRQEGRRRSRRGRPHRVGWVASGGRPMTAAELAPAPSTAAVSVCRNLIFEGMREIFDLAGSYAFSGSEAAYRGDETTLVVHIQQLQACVIEVIRLRDDLAARKAGKA